MSKLSDICSKRGIDYLQLAMLMGIGSSNARRCMARGIFRSGVARRYAAALGCDMREIWELAGGKEDPATWQCEDGWALLYAVVMDARMRYFWTKKYKGKRKSS